MSWRRTALGPKIEDLHPPNGTGTDMETEKDKKTAMDKDTDQGTDVDKEANIAKDLVD